MRARDFVTEQQTQAKLKPELGGPIKDTYIIPGLPSQDPYKTYRFGVAMARARAETVADFDEPFASEGPFGEYAVVTGIEDGVEELIDRALAMTNTPGGRRLMGSQHSEEPDLVNRHSPVKPFRGYPR
jgi:hypothetical protein